MLFELVARGHERGGAFDECIALVFDNRSGNRLAVVFHQRRLVIEHVKLAGGADHEHVDDALGLGAEHRRLWRGVVEQFGSVGGGEGFGNAAAKQRREGHLADADAAVGKELATGDLAQLRY